MLNYILTLLIVLFSTQLQTMESPFDLNLDEEIRVEEENNTNTTPTLAHDLQFFDATAKMLEAHEEFSKNYLKTAALAPLVHLAAIADIPALSEWKKKLGPIAMHLGSRGLRGLALQKKFDYKLAKEDEEVPNQNASIASRMALTKELAAFNEECQTCFENLKIIFGPELKNIAFQKFLTIKEIKDKISQFEEDDPDEQLFFLCDYVQFLNNEAQPQISLFNCTKSINKILAIPIARGTTPQDWEAYPTANVLQFCTSQIPQLEKQILELLRKQLNDLNKLSANDASCSEYTLKLLIKKRESFKEDAKEILDNSKRHKTLLSKQFLPRTQSYISELEELQDRLIKKFQKIVSQNSGRPQKPLPVSKLQVMPHSAQAIQQLKASYQYSMMFRVKHPIQELLGNTVSSVVYFFSRGSFINTGLQPTTSFVFKSHEQTHTLEQDTAVKQSDEILCYASNGNYYFINSALAIKQKEARGYKVDYVAALSFAQQQLPPAKIEPQV